MGVAYKIRANGMPRFHKSVAAKQTGTGGVAVPLPEPIIEREDFEELRRR